MSPSTRIWQQGYDLILLLTATLFCLITFNLEAAYPVYRLVALPTLLFVPGYLMTALGYPALWQLRISARIAYSLALSVALHIVLGMLLNFLPIGLQPFSYLTVLSVLCFGIGVAAYFARARLEPPIDLSRDTGDAPNASTWSWSKVRLIGYAIGWAAMFSTFFLFAFYPDPPSASMTTQLILAPPSQSRIQRASETNRESVQLSVVNTEGRAVTYNLFQKTTGKQEEIAAFTLENGSSWTASVEIEGTNAGQPQQIAFLLYQDGVLDAASRTVYLWLPPSTEAVTKLDEQ